MRHHHRRHRQRHRRWWMSSVIGPTHTHAHARTRRHYSNRALPLHTARGALDMNLRRKRRAPNTLKSKNYSLFRFEMLRTFANARAHMCERHTHTHAHTVCMAAARRPFSQCTSARRRLVVVAPTQNTHTHTRAHMLHASMRRVYAAPCCVPWRCAAHRRRSAYRVCICVCVSVCILAFTQIEHCISVCVCVRCSYIRSNHHIRAHSCRFSRACAHVYFCVYVCFECVYVRARARVRHRL